MAGWRRDQAWRTTGLRFLPPSPNIRTPRSALLYAGIGGFEATNVAVGRGTRRPFELFGAPWMDGPAMAARLAARPLPGFRFRAARFTPTRDRDAGVSCSGVAIDVTDEIAARPVDLFLEAFWLLRELHPTAFQPRWAELPRITGSSALEALDRSGAPVDDALRLAHDGAARFLQDRKPYLLYE
jgi:uncharacterized protein YbbC (DUF1343 family)